MQILDDTTALLTAMTLCLIMLGLIIFAPGSEPTKRNRRRHTPPPVVRHRQAILRRVA